MEITAQVKMDEYYEALLARDSRYVGIFYVGVVTTSVFCIATCRARKPKKKNVKFYKSYADALKNGFRPCKICCPTENANETPEQVAKAIQLVKENAQEKISDQTLSKNNISADLVRRWFKKNYGITFHAFQRMYRVNNAYKDLKDGKKTTDTAYETGYDSLSGFAYTFKKLIGKSPSKSKMKNVILINRLTTPLGPMFVCASDHGICLLEFTDRRMLETELSDLQRLMNARILFGENAHIVKLKKELEEYFGGKRKEFTVPLDMPGTPFQKKAWNALREISFGTTRTYESQAIRINRPKAVRAVGRANGQNRISIVVPCHRIIGKNGKLTGYGGGIERKKWLLDYERSI